MDEPRRRNLRWLLGIVAIALAAGTFLAASALAGGGNSTPPAAPPEAKAKVTPAAKARAKAKSHSGRNCPRDEMTSSLDV